LRSYNTDDNPKLNGIIDRINISDFVRFNNSIHECDNLRIHKHFIKRNDFCYNISNVKRNDNCEFFSYHNGHDF
jgi:hypothetical protein